jgi:DNA-binding transcriptional MerR regulator
MLQGQARIYPQAPLTIGTLARRVGLRPSAVRYYERLGIVPRPSRLPNGYRVYGEAAVKYLRLVRRAQVLGITLNEVRPLVQLVQRQVRPCEHVHTLVVSRLREVEAAIKEFELLRKQLRALVRQTRPGICQSSELCPSD